jgi:hypothetical protein
VTSERFLFDSTGGAVWSKPLAKLKSVNITTIRNSTALLLITQFDDLQKPHGFAIDSFSHPVSFLGRSSAITLNANDLVALLRSLIERRDKAV